MELLDRLKRVRDIFLMHERLNGDRRKIECCTSESLHFGQFFNLCALPTTPCGIFLVLCLSLCSARVPSREVGQWNWHLSPEDSSPISTSWERGQERGRREREGEK